MLCPDRSRDVIPARDAWGAWPQATVKGTAARMAVCIWLVRSQMSVLSGWAYASPL